MGALEGWLEVEGDRADVPERTLGVGWLAREALQVALGVALGVAALLVVVWAGGILAKVVEARFRIVGRRVGRRRGFEVILTSVQVLVYDKFLTFVIYLPSAVIVLRTFCHYDSNLPTL